jgi:hypothetical protein
MAKGDKERELVHLRTILYTALAEQIGLLVRVDDPKRARQRLYEARASSGDPALAVLQFRLSPGGSDLIAITKGSPKDE